MAYPEGLLTTGERIREHRRPHVRMLVLPALVPPVAVGVAMWLAALATRWRTHGGPWTWSAWIALAVVAAVVIGRFAVTPLLRWWCTHLVVTDRRLLVREGVLSRSALDVAAATITDVRTRQRGLERLLGCGTLVVGTRDAPGDPWEFHGIPQLAHTAARLGTVAQERGGRSEDEADLDDDPIEGELVDDDPFRHFDDDDLDDDAIEAELVEDDEPSGPVSRRARPGRSSAGRTSR